MFQKIAKHRANDASNDVHRPPLLEGLEGLEGLERLEGLEGLEGLEHYRTLLNTSKHH